MAFVEMGPVSKSLSRLVTKSVMGRKAKPLFTLEEGVRPRAARSSMAPMVEAKPLNEEERAEQDALHRLRDALHSDFA